MRAQCVARRLQRESARTAPIGERRHFGPARRRADSTARMMASRSPWVVVMSGAFTATAPAAGWASLPDLTPNRLRAFHARDAARQLRRQQPQDAMRPRIAEPLR